MLAVLNKSEGVTCGAAQGDGQSEDTGLRAGNVVRPKEKSPARNVKYLKNKQDNEVEDNQSVYVFKCEGSTVKVKDTPLLEPPPTGS